MPFCPPYQGLNGVATAVEFTLVPFGPDYYDVSVINGFNVGIEMKPSNRFDAIREEVAGSQKGYNCGAAGAFHQSPSSVSSFSTCSFFCLQNNVWLNDPRSDILSPATVL
jgi:hypothetical protein